MAKNESKMRKNVVFTWASFAPPADEVRAEHVKLSWEAPEDDGGTPIIKYIVRLLDLDYNEWINVCEAGISSSNRKIAKMSMLSNANITTYVVA
jgi:hypothetical protein